jgi:SAM-dependent methyltransferase
MATAFDSYAHDYDAALSRGLAVSGEDKSFFAKGRVVWLTRCLARLGFSAETVLDYGCGTGTSAPLFLGLLGARRVVGVDVSERSLQVARQTHCGRPVEYTTTDQYVPDGTIDLAFCNGVFHHVPPPERGRVIDYIARCLRPGGLLALWDNNPWNPGARYVMSRIPFDKEAVMLSARQAASLCRSAGLQPLSIHYCFIFPRVMRFLRFLEPRLARLPLGAQYQVLACKANDEG